MSGVRILRYWSARKAWIALLAFTLATHQSDAAFMETPSLSTVVELVGERTLVLLDIDDTLIYYPYQLGSTRWFEESYEAARGDPERMKQFHQIGGLLATYARVAPCESNTALFVSQLQTSGADVVGITGRSLVHPGIANWPEKTVEQVGSIGVSFSASSPFERRVEDEGELSFLIVDGVIHCGSSAKEDVVRRLLALTPNSYDQIIFVDDRRAEVERFEQAFGDARTHAIWYRRMEPHNASYDSDVAARQLAHLLKERQMLSDDKAAALQGLSCVGSGPAS